MVSTCKYRYSPCPVDHDRPYRCAMPHGTPTIVDVQHNRHGGCAAQPAWAQSNCHPHQLLPTWNYFNWQVTPLGYLWNCVQQTQTSSSSFCFFPFQTQVFFSIIIQIEPPLLKVEKLENNDVTRDKFIDTIINFWFS